MRERPFVVALCVVVSIVMAGCSSQDDESILTTGPGGNQGRTTMGAAVFTPDDEVLVRRPQPNPDRLAFYGDLHVHTVYSFDAYAFGTLATPYDAYRFAKGEAIAHPGGFELQLKQPLDFYAVTDHAMFLGVMAASADTSTEFSKLEVSKPLNDLNAPDNLGLTSLLPRIRAFGNFLPRIITDILDKNRTVIKTWIVTPRTELLLPGEKTVFEDTYTDPPKAAVQLSVRLERIE